MRLSCGGRVLSEADNWYVLARLTPEMNRLLGQATIPFGVPCRRGFPRELLGAEPRWHPLPDGKEMQAALPTGGSGALAIPDQVLEHRAVLLTPFRSGLAARLTQRPSDGPWLRRAEPLRPRAWFRAGLHGKADWRCQGG